MDQTISANDWVLAFIESERSAMRHCKAQHDPFAEHSLRIASCDELAQLATSAIALIRTCLPHPATTRPIVGPKLLDVSSSSTPRSAFDDSADEEPVEKAAGTVGPIPAEDTAAIAIRARAPRAVGEAASPAGAAALLAAAALHAAALLANVIRRAAALLATAARRAASLRGALGRPRPHNGRPAVGDGRVAGRPAAQSRFLLRGHHQRGGDAGH
jgi:hypothetical protein